MNSIAKLKFFLLVFLLSFSSNAMSNDKIVSLNMNTIIEKSLAGKSIKDQLVSIDKKNNNFFLKKQKLLQKKEKELISKKNILSNDEYKNEVLKLQKEIEVFNGERKKRISSYKKNKQALLQKLLNEINPILTNYSKANNISMIIDQKNLIISKNEIDITAEVLKLLDSKIKKITTK